MNKLIYAVDDEENIRDLYQILISQAGYDVLCFDNNYKMLESLEKKLPDLIILDIMVDGIDGYETIKILRNDERFESIPVIFVSAKSEEISKVKGLNLGADDYISKPFGIMEFIARINAKLRLNKQTNIYNYKDLQINNDKHEVILNNKTIDLSMTEYNLLLFLVKNNNKAIDREVIWKNVWKDEYVIETRSLDMYIAKLRKILDNSDITIESIRGIGYKLK